MTENIKKFLTQANIPYHKFWYYISDKTGKKTPIGEKNNIKIEDIPKQDQKNISKPKSIFVKSKDPAKKYDEILLSKTELESLQRSYTIFLKYTDNVYCIDIDDKEINSMDDFINKTGCSLFKNCCWIQGNTKGIHIYTKINNMVSYSDQQGVYNGFDGDLIQKNNMWERSDKIVHNSENGITAFEYDDIKHIFNDKINPKPVEKKEEKKKTKKDVKKEDTPEEKKANDNENEPVENASELETYIDLGVKHKIFEKMTGHTIWTNIGFIIKNQMGEDGEDWFVKISESDPKFDENYVRGYYRQLLDKIVADHKKPLTIKTLIKYFKDADKDTALKILKDANKIIKPKNKPKSPYEDEDVDITFEPDKLSHFDSKYINTFKGQYKVQKKYIEHFISKVLRPEPQYIYIEGNKDIGRNSCIFSEGNIRTAFRHIETTIETSDDFKDVRFTDLWLNDPSIKCFNKLDFIPYNGFEEDQKDDKIYNLFTGYNPKILSSYNKEKSDIILKPFIELGLELCGGDMKHFEYFMKFMGHMIQKPNERIPICFIIKGKQGTGKNVFLNAIGSIVGKEHYITSANPKDFFGDYAEGFYHKLLVNMNECEGKDTFDFEGKIKSFITEDTITINPKNVRPSQIRNVARVLIFTNKPNPIPIDVKSSDRRYCVYQTTDKFLDKKYGTKFWTKLIEHFNKPEFIACLYDYLNNIDINVDWRAERPITEAYKEMCKLYVPIEALFFESYVNNYRGCLIKNALDDGIEGTDNESEDNNNNDWEQQQEPRNKDIYDEYVKFCKSNGFSNDKTFQPSISKFNNRITELEIPHNIVKSNGYNELRFTPKNIYDHLIKRKWINRDENDDDVIVEDVGGEDFEFEI